MYISIIVYLHLQLRVGGRLGGHQIGRHLAVEGAKGAGGQIGRPGRRKQDNGEDNRPHGGAGGGLASERGWMLALRVSKGNCWCTSSP